MCDNYPNFIKNYPFFDEADFTFHGWHCQFTELEILEISQFTLWLHKASSQYPQPLNVLSEA